MSVTANERKEQFDALCGQLITLRDALHTYPLAVVRDRNTLTKEVERDIPGLRAKIKTFHHTMKSAEFRRLEGLGIYPMKDKSNGQQWLMFDIMPHSRHINSQLVDKVNHAIINL